MANQRTDIHITAEEVEQFKVGLISVYRLSQLKNCDKNSIKGRLKKLGDPVVDKLLTMSVAEIKEYVLNRSSNLSKKLVNRLTENDVSSYMSRASNMEILASHHGVSTVVIKRWLKESGVTDEMRNARRDKPIQRHHVFVKHKAFQLMDAAFIGCRS